MTSLFKIPQNFHKISKPVWMCLISSKLSRGFENFESSSSRTTFAFLSYIKLLEGLNSLENVKNLARNFKSISLVEFMVSSNRKQTGVFHTYTSFDTSMIPAIKKLRFIAGIFQKIRIVYRLTYPFLRNGIVHKWVSIRICLWRDECIRAAVQNWFAFMMQFRTCSRVNVDITSLLRTSQSFSRVRDTNDVKAVVNTFLFFRFLSVPLKK